MAIDKNMMRLTAIDTRIVTDTRVARVGDLIEGQEEVLEERTIAIDCHSGDWQEFTWVGIPIEPLFNAVDIPSSTTHVQVDGSDEQRACIPIGQALNGVLALSQNGTRLTMPRFVAPGIAGPRTIKSVRRIETRELSSGADRTEYEHLVLKSDAMEL